MRRCLLGAVLVATLVPCGRLRAADQTALIPQTTAARHGLKRAWFTQVEMDQSRTRINAIVLYQDALYVQSDRAMVHAINAETGETLWARRVGRADHPSMTPGVNRDLIAIVNGSRLYVCNRYNGDLLFETDIEGAPGAGAALSDKRAYVPMVDGMITAYRLESLVDPAKELGIVEDVSTEEDKAAAEQTRRENLRLNLEYITPLNCKSYGRALVQPLVLQQSAVEEFVAWSTDKGRVYIGRIDRIEEDAFSERFFVQAKATIAAQPTYLPPDPNKEGDTGIVFCASRDGLVYAVRDTRDQAVWQFSSGEPIVQPAVVVEPRVFVATQLGGLYCLDLKTGRETWWAPKILQFVAASKDRVYAADRLGQIQVLDIKTGMRLDTLPTGRLPIKMINMDTDRMYLATETGLVQCLHELQLSKPIRHSEDRKKGIRRAQEAEQKGVDQVQPPAGQQPPADAADGDPFNDPGGNPFGGDDNPLEDGGQGNGANDNAADGDPFRDNAGGGAANDDPFGNDPFG